MPRFRKKLVVIEAFQMTQKRRTDNSEWPEWLNRAWNKDRGAPGAVYPLVKGDGMCQLVIGTLEGEHLVSWGDFIIQSVQGELYPCKPQIFADTYESACPPDRRRHGQLVPEIVDVPNRF